MQQVLDEKDATITQLRHVYDELMAQTDYYRQACANFRNQIKYLQDIISTRESEISAKGKRIAMMEYDMSVRQAQYDTQEKHIDTYLNSIESLRQQISNKDGLFQQVYGNLEIAENQIDKLNSKIDALTSQIELLESERYELLTKIKDIKDQSIDKNLHEVLKKEVMQKQQEISVLESEIRLLSKELSLMHNEKSDMDEMLNDKSREYDDLKDELDKTLIALAETEKRISELERALEAAPSENDLVERDREIDTLKSKISEYEQEINGLIDNQQENYQSEIIVPDKVPESRGSSRQDIGKATTSRPRTENIATSHHGKRSVTPSQEVITVDFPKIENDINFSPNFRTIDTVFDCHSNSLVSADDVFKKSAEEISQITLKLEEAVATGEKYLICPSCKQMVKISCRRVGHGTNIEVRQFFTHAVRNLPCDLKRNSYDSLDNDEDVNDGFDSQYINQMRSLMVESLKTHLSMEKGVSDVKESFFVTSDELPVMGKKRADVTARYKDVDIVFEFVKLNTKINHVHDCDDFYFINHKQVFWIFGLEAITDYRELTRAVSKYILFTNRRNVFVLDPEAQDASRKHGELILKCNWLDDNGEWYYQMEKDGTNGTLVSLDQIHFSSDSCRPYYTDADTPFFAYNPSAEPPINPSKKGPTQSYIGSQTHDKESPQIPDQTHKEDHEECPTSRTEDLNHLPDTNDSPAAELISITETGCHITKLHNKYGLEKDGIVLIPHMYDALSFWYTDKYIAQKKDKFGLIDSTNNVLLEFEYSSITPPVEGIGKVIKGNSQYDIDCNLKIFKDSISLQDGYTKIKINGKWGIINSKGNRIVEIVYDEITSFCGNLIGIVNGELNLLAPFPYVVPMRGESLGIKDGINLISVADVEFQNTGKRKFREGESEEFCMIEWAEDIPYPKVVPIDENGIINQAKHIVKKHNDAIDTQDDFLTGETYDARILSIMKRGVNVKVIRVKMQNHKILKIYKSELIRSPIDESRLREGMTIKIKKKGYNENLYRTKWRIEQILTP